jgi:hypothetical protein
MHKYGQTSLQVKLEQRGLHTANIPLATGEYRGPDASLARPFITIARQIGAECPSLPKRLAEELNECGRGVVNWSHWDQELIERVSAESHIPAEFFAAMETSAHSWVDDILSGIAGRPEELAIFHRVKETVRRLAACGHVILVGHGSTYMTQDLAGGLRIRLIAPMDYRINTLASQSGLSLRGATRSIRHLDKRRKKFFARYWPGRPLAPEGFTATFNIVELDEEKMIRAIMAMLPDECGVTSS